MAIVDFYHIYVAPHEHGDAGPLMSDADYRAMCSARARKANRTFHLRMLRELGEEDFIKWKKHYYSRKRAGKEGPQGRHRRTAKTRQTVVDVAAHQSDVPGVSWHENTQAWVAS
ncbi:unnamed protein product [Vitrella brassicaformis CCMP3155]|uniref:Uncharacterized protein n=1 Tax=Vitrella brassicaformis (strain CCMP3155) TaxID=1169540 RepID=A0A0G4GW43_VITBC|nr:unnamed protein product [Vitrella brassicaformis CCMP3155]|eukprot:CEM35182.1 unnamed protein product [Vitrella brassicaformis CCMP3155]